MYIRFALKQKSFFS